MSNKESVENNLQPSDEFDTLIVKEVRKRRRKKMRNQLREQLAKYEDYVRTISARGTWIRYAGILECFAEKFEGKTKVEHIFTSDVEDYRLLRIKEGINPSTVNLEIRVLKGFLHWYERMNGMPNAIHVKKLREVEKPVRALNFAEIQALLTAATDPKERLMVLLLVTTGVRGDELVKLERRDFDFENAMLNLPAEKTKTKRARHLEMRADVLALVKECPEGRLFEGFANGQKTLAYRFKRLCWKAEVRLNPRDSLHMTRKTFATNLVRAGCDLNTVRLKLGHSSLSTTAKYLAGMDSSAVRSVLESLPLEAAAGISQ
jgi:integrase